MTGGFFSACYFLNSAPLLGCRIMTGPLFWPLSLWVMSGILCILMRVSALCKKGVMSFYPCFLTLLCILCKYVSLRLLFMLGILNGGGGKLVGDVCAYYIRANIRENCILYFSHSTLFGSQNVYCPLFHLVRWRGNYHLSAPSTQ